MARLLRGPYLPVLSVCVMLFINYSVYDGLIRWKWPIVSWQMYGAKSHLEPNVTFGGLVVFHADGRRATTADCGTLPFLAHPYRLDAALRSDRVELLTICLRELRTREPSVEAVAHEVRRWDYQEQRLAAALDQPSLQEVRVAALPGGFIDDAPAATSSSLLSNGDFSRFDRRTGLPLAWSTQSRHWSALGVDLQTGNRSALVLREPGGKAARWEQKLQLPVTAQRTRLRVEALVHAGKGATVSLHVPGLEPARARVAEEAAHWQRLELELEAPARPKQVTASLRLTNSGASHFFVDNVSLTEAL